MLSKLNDLKIKQLAQQSINDHNALMQSLSDEFYQDLLSIAKALITSLENSNKILICGNGGSAADAQHFAAELVGRYQKERISLPAIALTTDSSNLTAIGNDYGFQQVFARQVLGLGNPGDSLIVISTSGNSNNIIAAIDAARAKNLTVVALLGKDGGAIAKLLTNLDKALIIKHNVTARIQEAHITVLHLLCEIIDAHY